ARGTGILLVISCDDTASVTRRALVIARWHKNSPARGRALRLASLAGKRGSTGYKVVGCILPVWVWSGVRIAGRKFLMQRASCIHCGRPRAATVTTVELTSKRFKSQQLRGGVLMAAGLAIGIVGSGIHPAVAGLGSLFFLVGLFVWIGGRFGAWWQHGLKSSHQCSLPPIIIPPKPYYPD